MTKIIIFCKKIVVLIFTLFSVSLTASIYDYIYPKSSFPSFSNYGTIGLIQMPTARTMDEGSLAFSWSNSDPYLRGSIIAYPFSWMEASYQYTDVNNALYSDSPAFSGNQTYKDKSFDVKIKFLNQKKHGIDVAIGARDLAGTGVFGSEFLVATKSFNNVDLTFGMGWGVLSNDKHNNPLSYVGDRFKKREKLGGDTRGGEFNVDAFFSGPVSYFAGIEYVIPNLNGGRFKFEYDVTDYELEGFPFGRDSFEFAFEPVKQPDSPFNFGFLYPVSDLLHLKFNYIKGNTINFGFSLQASLGGKDPFIKKRDKLRLVADSRLVRNVTGKDDELLYKASIKYLNEREIFVQGVNISNETLHILYSQSKFQSYIRSAGRAFTVMDEISPDKINTLKVSNINAGMGMHSIEIDRNTFRKYKDDSLYTLATKDITIKPERYNINDIQFNPTVDYPTTFWKFSPSIRSQIGGPDGFYFGDLRISFHAETLFSKRLTLKTDISYGLYDNFSELRLKSDSILPHVRTDINEYLKEGSKTPIINRLQLNYFNELTNEVFYKLSAGLMESMFGGFGGEILYRPFYSDFAVGAELWRVRQRDYDQTINFRSYKTDTGHVNLYYKHPQSQVLFHIKGGRFLAKDSGFSFDFSRRFKSGLRIGAFFSLTDISKSEFGEGSFDKGFYFFIPIETFFDRYSKPNTGFGLRPITRDGGASLIHSLHLYGVTEQAHNMNLTRDLDDLYE